MCLFARMPISSRIFLKNRALGYVSNHVPCVFRYSKIREEYLISTCVGRAFHTYGSKHLTLLCVSDTVEEDITCMATDSVTFYTASGPVIHAWSRNSVVKYTYRGHTHTVNFLLPFGDHLISVDEGNVLKIWVHKTQENILTLEFSSETFQITAIVHPSTYLNKILLGSDQGMLQLWNIKSSKLIYTFNGWGSAITALQQAPALDVIAVGLKDGRIILHNIKYDQSVVDFKQEWGPITSVSFRTDGPPIMVTGSKSGNIVLWDLEERKVASHIMEAHQDTVSSVLCFPREPLLVSSSPDNSLKMWIFDQADSGGRLLKFREGHSSQPNCIRFYHPHHLLSAGNDSTLRVFNTITESLNYSLGRASYDRTVMKKKKWTSEYLLMPPITHFSACSTREKEWDNIAAIHRGIPVVTTWSYEKRRLGSHKLLPKRLEHQTRVTLTDTATCVHVTNCGNFVVIGYSTGHIDRFNIQSGIHRCSYGGISAHKGAIRGVAVDALNQTLISGCNAGLLKIWNFKPKKGGSVCPNRIAALPTGDSVSFFRLHTESSLIGIVLENYVLSLLDVEARKIVRRFMGHTGQITDAAFSPDARWIVTSSIDSTIRVWDIPTACTVDLFKVDSPCTSLAFSPTGNYLATLHVNNVGIYLWTNKTQFSHVSLKPIKDNEEVPTLELPGTGVERSIKLDASDSEEEDEDIYKLRTQIEDLITFSNLPSSRWKNLFDIEIIKMRNKPKEPPKAPPNAPFFLPTLPGKDIVFDFSSVTPEDGLKTVKLNQIKNYTIFGNLLSETDPKNFSVVIEKLKTMSPSGIDFEINSLGLEAQGSLELLDKFMSLIEYMLSSNRDFELAQSYLGLFLKVHGKTILEQEVLYEHLKHIKYLQTRGWDGLENDIMFCLSAISVLKP